MMRRLVVIVLIWGGFLSPNVWSRPNFQPVTSSYLDPLISSLSLREKIGQLLIVGVKGKTLTPETEKLLTDLKVGGVIIYSHNISDPTQIRTLISQMQDTAVTSYRIPLFMAVDQEGGSVARVRAQTTILPTAMAIGATRSSQFAFLSGKMTAQTLLALGMNMNLAPVLDMNTTDRNMVIGVRSYGDDPDLVSDLGMWYVEGLQSQGIVATAKHFPGHGDTVQDSHYVVPVLNKSLQDLERFHLVPFRRAIDNGLDAIMSAHISVPALDPSGLPATFSYALLTRLIRDKMNFKGVIITDDLEMKSIQDQYSTSDAAVKALLAGNDLIMVSWTDSKKYEVIKSIYEAVRTGKISEDRINDSVKRILALKYKRGLFQMGRRPSSIDDLTRLSEENKSLVKKIAKRAVTVVFTKDGVFPIKENDPRRILLVTSLPQFYRDLKYFHDKIIPFYLSHRPTMTEIAMIEANIMKYHKKTDLILFGVTHQSQLGLVNKISTALSKEVAVVSFGSPYFLKELKNISSYICSYDTHRDLIYATAEVIAGIAKPTGQLPVTIQNQIPSVVENPSLIKAENK